MTPEYIDSVANTSQRLFALTADAIAGAYRPMSHDGSLGRVEGRYNVLRRSDPNRLIEVSVVIPTFNRPRLIRHAIESVSRQRHGALEIIVVDDAGESIPDQLFEETGVHLTVIRHHQNLGLGASRNTGASIARGEWLMMLDDDDTLVDGSIGLLLEASRTSRSATFLYGDHLRQWYDGDLRGSLELFVTAGSRFSELHIENPVMCGSFLIRRESFMTLNGYREDLPVHEDYNFHLRIISSQALAYVNTPICVYHCRHTIPRLNHKRLYWFATSAFNHAVFRSLFCKVDDQALKVVQRTNQYEHLARALREGCPVAVAKSLVGQWWQALAGRKLQGELATDEVIAARLCPELYA